MYGQGGGPYQAPNLTMKILGWNCRGICNASTVQALRAQINKARQDVIFLSEAKAKEKHMEFVKNSIKFYCKCTMDPKGYASRLCILWKASVNIKEVDFNKNLIAIRVSDAICNWLFVGFYGLP